jgi:hypothetical protein
MAPARLSRLQRRILAWLVAEEQRTRGTMAASHQELVSALGADKGNISYNLRRLEDQHRRKGLRGSGAATIVVKLQCVKGRQPPCAREEEHLSHLL